MKPVDFHLKTTTSELKYFVASTLVARERRKLSPPSTYILKVFQILHILCFMDTISETETHFFLVKFLNNTSENMNQKRPVSSFWSKVRYES